MLAFALASPTAAGTAVAAPPAAGGNCVSVLTSYYGPQGEVDDAVRTLKQQAAAKGMTFGQLAKTLRAQHGTVDQCLAFLDLP